jgi:hypothetical protein
VNSKFALSFDCDSFHFLFLAGFTSAQHVTYDFIISGGHIVDRTGAPLGRMGILESPAVLVQPKMEKGRFPLVSNSPFRAKLL